MILYLSISLRSDHIRMNNLHDKGHSVLIENNVIGEIDIVAQNNNCQHCE